MEAFGAYSRSWSCVPLSRSNLVCSDGILACNYAASPNSTVCPSVFFYRVHQNLAAFAAVITGCCVQCHGHIDVFDTETRVD
jgi:hypothetical protein